MTRLNYKVHPADAEFIQMNSEKFAGHLPGDIFTFSRASGANSNYLLFECSFTGYCPAGSGLNMLCPAIETSPCEWIYYLGKKQLIPIDRDGFEIDVHKQLRQQWRASSLLYYTYPFIPGLEIPFFLYGEKTVIVTWNLSKLIKVSNDR